VLAECSWDPDLNGLSLAQVLQRRSRPVTVTEAAELVIELQYAGGCSVIYHAMNAASTGSAAGSAAVQ